MTESWEHKIPKSELEVLRSFISEKNGSVRVKWDEYFAYTRGGYYSSGSFKDHVSRRFWYFLIKLGVLSTKTDGNFALINRMGLLDNPSHIFTLFFTSKDEAEGYRKARFGVHGGVNYGDPQGISIVRVVEVS